MGMGVLQQKELRKRKRTPHKKFGKMTSLHANNLESALLADPRYSHVLLPNLDPFSEGILPNPPNCRT